MLHHPLCIVEEYANSLRTFDHLPTWILAGAGPELPPLFIDAATKARYWITFFVFSVLPAPDSPLETINVER